VGLLQQEGELPLHCIASGVEHGWRLDESGGGCKWGHGIMSRRVREFAECLRSVADGDQ
jgi:hypothetical protein